MQNLLTDINPEFSVGEQAFIISFDIDANCYNMGKGPDCGRKWYEAHDIRPMVPIDEVSEEMLHPDILYFNVEDHYLDHLSSGDEDTFIMGAERIYDDRYSLMALRCAFPEIRTAEDADEVADTKPQKARRRKSLGNWPRNPNEFPAMQEDMIDDNVFPVHIGWGKNRCMIAHYPRSR